MTVDELRDQLARLPASAEVYIECEEELVLLDLCEQDDDGDVVLSPAEDEDEE